ncbi:MAG: polysaccharide biosynthesis/export family protein [Candidatus Latescibacteria bacterium]|nr:polysaccharide biosynthesis/export family protein [Candidatus Latescibacterota bacterium]
MTLFWRMSRTPAGRALIALVTLVFTNAVLGVTGAVAQVQQPQTQPQTQTLPADYRVGPGDGIFLSVPQRPDLNRDLVVDANGNVNMPLIGRVMVKGMTDSEIESRLLQALREYYPSVNRVEVSVTRASSNVIWISGEVKVPGKYSFTHPINVWEAIREAGGPNATASLDGVRIIKDRSRGGTTSVVDVSAAIEAGSVDKLPGLDPGDTIIVPAKQQEYTGSQGINVMGGVIRPGVYPMQGRQDLMTALLQAGGPNERAKLDDVRLIRPRGDGTAETMKIDLKKFLEKGEMGSNPTLRPGDTIAVGRKGFTSQELTTVLAFITAAGTMILLYFTIQNEIEDNQTQTAP